jgi:putative inorganic carbon (HCO3(-)) transporter
MERLAFSLGSTHAVPAAAEPRAAAPPASPAAAVAAAAPRRASEDDDRIAFKALLAFTFVLFIRPQDTLPFLRPLHLADITATIALVTLIWGRMARGVAITRYTPELVAIAGIGAVMLATAPFSLWPGGAVAVFTELYIKVILVFALIVNTVTTRARFEKLVTVIVLGTSYIGVRAVIDYARGVNLVEGSRVTGAVGGLFGNPNDMALNMVAFLPLAIVLALRKSRPLIRLLAFIGVPALAMAIVFSQSRGGVVGLVAMLVVLLYHMRRLRPGIAALVVAATLAYVPFLPESFVDRMSSIFNPEEDPTGSREARKRLLREGYAAFLANPLVGIGAGQFKNYLPDEREEAWRETHNAVLQVAAELGIAGLVLFLAVVAGGFRAGARAAKALRRARRQNQPRAPGGAWRDRDPLELYTAAMIASLTGWFAAAMFASVAYYWTFYLVLGLAAALREVTLAETGTMQTAGRTACRAEAA